MARDVTNRGGSGGASPPALFTHTTITSKSPSEAVFIISANPLVAPAKNTALLAQVPKRNGGENGGKQIIHQRGCSIMAHTSISILPSLLCHYCGSFLAYSHPSTITARSDQQWQRREGSIDMLVSTMIELPMSGGTPY